ncbi:hypothetical protein [Paraburkholderia hayleyella]|uniref:hypothetical protein n=1 Tax=Paraburkholderia hayleyella TaxID=2152889 RepID=UPI0012915C83|nr:hypothetical protein [Paraburkholderia hayleyella]
MPYPGKESLFNALNIMLYGIRMNRTIPNERPHQSFFDIYLHNEKYIKHKHLPSNHRRFIAPKRYLPEISAKKFEIAQQNSPTPLPHGNSLGQSKSQ